MNYLTTPGVTAKDFGQPMNIGALSRYKFAPLPTTKQRVFRTVVMFAILWVASYTLLAAFGFFISLLCIIPLGFFYNSLDSILFKQVKKDSFQEKRNIEVYTRLYDIFESNAAVRVIITQIIFDMKTDFYSPEKSVDDILDEVRLALRKMKIGSGGCWEGHSMLCAHRISPEARQWVNETDAVHMTKEGNHD
jgi:hypothetical protein